MQLCIRMYFFTGREPLIFIPISLVSLLIFVIDVSSSSHSHYSH